VLKNCASSSTESQAGPAAAALSPSPPPSSLFLVAPVAVVGSARHRDEESYTLPLCVVYVSLQRVFPCSHACLLEDFVMEIEIGV